MKLLNFLALVSSIASLVWSCTSSGNDHLTLRVSTTVADGDKRHSETKVVDGEYFETAISSISYRDGTKRYVATKDLESTQPGGEFHTKFSTVVDEHDSTQFFTSPEDFLNYMSARGYEMASQKEKRYGADYTFKKK